MVSAHYVTEQSHGKSSDEQFSRIGLEAEECSPIAVPSSSWQTGALPAERAGAEESAKALMTRVPLYQAHPSIDQRVQSAQELNDCRDAIVRQIAASCQLNLIPRLIPDQSYCCDRLS